MSPIDRELRSIIREPSRIHPNEPMKRHTTFRIGGPADFLLEVADRRELGEVLAFARQERLLVYVLGRGSNLLVSDEGVRGLVLALTGEFNRCAFQETRLTVGGGFNLPKLAMQAARMSLTGLEFAVAIPGTVGAGLVINAGAHGGDLSKVVRCAAVVWPDGRAETLSHDEIGFGYRTSRLGGTSAVVVEVVMDLRKGTRDGLQENIHRLLEHRRSTQPLNLPNAGSVFKNPTGDFAGRLIEQAGCKGLREGNAQVSEKHANFIVNIGNATARDVLILLDRVRKSVQDRFGVRLEPEVKIWGDNPYFHY